MISTEKKVRLESDDEDSAEATPKEWQKNFFLLDVEQVGQFRQAEISLKNTSAIEFKGVPTTGVYTMLGGNRVGACLTRSTNRSLLSSLFKDESK